MLKFLLSFFEVSGKVVGGMAAIVAVVGFVFPPVGNSIAAFVAWRFGNVGYVYYETDQNRELVGSAGQLYLLKAGDGRYAEIGLGDRLRAESTVNFRSGPSLGSGKIFEIETGECVTVLTRAENPDLVLSGFNGWLHVATSSCGIFR